MAAEYFLYNTGYSNTLIARSNTSFAPLPPNTGEIFIDYFIPTNQPLSLYRESGGTIIVNDYNTINNYMTSIAPAPQPDDNLFVGTFSGYTGATYPDKYVLVKSANDLPTPVNSVISLVDYTTYHINGLINIGSNQIELGQSNVIQGDNPVNDIIYSNTSGATIFGFDKSGLFNRLSFVNLNHTTGTLFNLTGTTSKQIYFSQLYFVSSNVGKVGGYRFIVLDTVNYQGIYDGIEFFGATGTTGGSKTFQTDIFVNKNLVTNQAANNINIFNVSGGIIDSLKLWDNNIYLTDSNNFLYVDSGTTSYQLGTLGNGIVSGNEIFQESGSSTVLSGITQHTLGWVMSNNRNINDSIILGFIEFVNNTSATIVSATNTFYKVAGTNTGNTVGYRTNVSTNNRILYNCPCKGTINSNFIVSGSLYVPNNNQTINIAIRKNGTTNIGTTKVRCVTAFEPVNFTFNQINDVAIDDYYEIFVSNITAARDVYMETLQFKLTANI